ncbi:MAG: UDP-N-acetylglucosamine 2-epimerase [Methanothrix sp.]|jgi:UDP-N-acetylglucosamine 2-epimerase|uniref:UDP-N-acetylglucosamine 2-epimerase n=1 Tax=Methanothrix sp. TaxID=90426 RepID=UPI003BB8023B
MKIAFIIGIKPEFVQAEPVINNLKKHVSNMLFAPTNTAVINLSKEGISECVCNTGDVMFDSLLQKTDSIKNNRDILDEYNLQAQNYFLMTLHRSETTERFENLKNILLAIKESGKQFAWLS